MSTQNKVLIESLEKEIESQKQKINDVEQKNIEKASCKSKRNESFKMIMEMMEKDTQLNEESMEELQKMNQKLELEIQQLKGKTIKLQDQLKVENEQHNAKIAQLETKLICNQKLELENQQHKEKAMKLEEELKAQNEQLNVEVVELENQIKCNQKLALENQQLKGKLDVMKHMVDEFLKTVGTLHMKVMEKEAFNQALIIREHQNNDELQKAPKKLVKEVIDDEDQRLEGLEKELGAEAYNAVVTKDGSIFEGKKEKILKRDKQKRKKKEKILKRDKKK